MYFNIRSLKKKNKLENIIMYLQKHKRPDFLFLTETWLKNTDTKYFKIMGYQGLHNCRNTRGGGVAVYVKEGLQFELLDAPVIEKCNIVGIKLANFKYKFLCLYRSPKNNMSTYLAELNKLLENYQNTVIIGDMNINVLKSSRICKKYLDIIALNSYQIKNCEQKKIEITRRNKTRSKGSLIDHVIAPNNLLCSMKTKDVSISDHKMLDIKFTLKQKLKLKSTKLQKQKTDYYKFKQTLTEKLSRPVDSYGSLIDIIMDAKIASTVMSTVKTYNIPWFNNSIYKTMKERDKAYRKMKTSPENPDFKKQFKKLRNQVTKLIRKSKTDISSRRLQAAGNNMKKTWKVINELMGCPSGDRSMVPARLQYNGRQLNTDEEIANGFNCFYKNMAADLQKKLEVSPVHFDEVVTDCSICLQQCTDNELDEIVSTLKSSSSAGPDGITSRDIKQIYPIIKVSLLAAINKCFKTGEFPSLCKISKIVPVYKKGDKHQPQNYRPISINSVLSKILEKAMKNRFSRFFSLSAGQYGFQKGSSTQGAAVDLIESITTKLETKNHVIVVFIDLEKAFDTVQHDVLLRKLHNTGIRGPAFKLTSSFLKGRLQYTKINKSESSTLAVDAGVPQGSVLGPLLYLIYVESLALAGLKGEHFMFADDTALVYHGQDLQRLEILVNSDLSRFHNWLCANCLVINESKTVFMHFHPRNKTTIPIAISINNKPIEKVNSCKYLGLIVDDKLTWDCHIDNIINKQLCGLVGCLRRINEYLSNECRYLLYNSHILSVLSYLVVLWMNTSVYNMNRLQRFQNKAIKAIFRLPYDLPTVNLYQGLPLLPLSKLRKLELCKLIHRLAHGEIKMKAKLIVNQDKHSHDTRSAGDFAVPRRLTSTGVRTPIYQGIKLYNDLPRDMKINKSVGFSRSLKKFLLNEQYE